MLSRSCIPLRGLRLLGGMLAMGLLPILPVLAQEADPGDPGSNYGTDDYSPPRDQSRIGSDSTLTPETTDPKAEGPVRMARFAYVQGNVSWRPDGNSEWSKATTNLPLRQGAEIWVTDGRADIQFDDGSSLRLGKDALAILNTLYSDKEGEFTQITLNDGLATLHSRHDDAVYQVDTPAASVKFRGGAQVRFGIDGGSEIAVQSGSATVEGTQGKITVEAGKYLYLADANSPYKERTLPSADSWDRWNSERNRLIEGKSETYSHVPPNIGLVAEDLDAYGSWHNDPKYGWVWVPRVSEPDWRPYYYGHWVWVDPFGWTWVSNEPWGWAPYHYGTWVQLSFGWSWCPGPRYQYWSPGVVSFCSYGGRIGWAPLCPWEVRYPATFTLGFGRRDWWLSFSIGWAGCYYPQRDGFCVGRRFDNVYVNRSFRNISPSFERFSHSAEGFAANHPFVPYNASRVAGATVASASAFGGRGSYQALARGDSSFFSRGQTVSAPAGRTPFSSPLSVQPTGLARTSTRSFLEGARPPQEAQQRNITHAPLPSNVQRSQPVSQNRGTIARAGQSHTPLTEGNSARRNGASGAGDFSGRPGNGVPSGSDGRNSYSSGPQRGNSNSAAESARHAREALGGAGQRGNSGFSHDNGPGSGYNGSPRSNTGVGERSPGGARGNGEYTERSTGAPRGNGGYSERSPGSSGRGGYDYSSPNSGRRGYSGGGYSAPRGSDDYSNSRNYRVGPGYGGGNSGGRGSGSSGGSSNYGGGRSSSGSGGYSGGRSGGGGSSGGRSDDGGSGRSGSGGGGGYGGGGRHRS